MLSKLLSKVKEEKKKSPQKSEGKQETNPEKNELDGLEEKYLSSRPFSFENLSQYRIPSINTVYYVPNYITQDDEKCLLKYINSQPPERWSRLQHANRRLQRWGGEVTKNGLENSEPLPLWLEKISELLCKEKITEKKTNHVLLNEYSAGIGIMPHTDGPLYHPYVVILSLESHACFEFFRDYAAYKEDEYLAKLLVEPRSLLIFTDEAYSKYLHSIQDKILDIIDVKYSVDRSSNSIKINKTNLDNFHLTHLYEEIKQNIPKEINTEEEEKEFTRTWELKRNQRISLTIRYVPSSN